MVLLSTNVAFAVISSQLLAILILKEHFEPKYDIIALTLLIAGCLVVVFCANYEEVEYSSTRVMHLMKSPVSITFYTLYVFLCIFTYIMNRHFRKGLTSFNTDANLWLRNKLNQNKDSSILSTALNSEIEDSFEGQEVLEIRNPGEE